jgi:hypothetical protein
MINILLAIQIITSTPKVIESICQAESCTFVQQHLIFFSKDVPDSEFILYHEIGHNLYWDNNPANNGIFSSQQRLADNFAWYVMAQRHPNRYIDKAYYWTYKSFYESCVTKEQQEMFKNTCGQECLTQVYKMYDKSAQL